MPTASPSRIWAGRVALALAVGAAAGAFGIIDWVVWWRHDERTEAGLHHSSGVITSGQRFGVSVGMRWKEADARLRSEFTPDVVLWEVGAPNDVGGGVTYGETPVLTGDATVNYRDRSWRNGVITLKLHDGGVSAIQWAYGGPFFVDF